MSAPATEQVRAAIIAAVVENAPNDTTRPQGRPKVLQQISVNLNVVSPVMENFKAAETMPGNATSPCKSERVFSLPPHPRVGSTTRRAVLCWARRSTGRNGMENKDNAGFSTFSLATASVQGLVMA